MLAIVCGTVCAKPVVMGTCSLSIRYACQLQLLTLHLTGDVVVQSMRMLLSFGVSRHMVHAAPEPSYEAMRPGEEYNGDLEGWEVKRLYLVFMCFNVSLCVTGLQVALQTSSLPSTSKHYCLFLGQGYVMHCCAEFIWYQCRPCTTSSYAPHERWA